MAEFVGQSGDLLFFKSENKGVIIDSAVSMIVASGNADTLGNNADWQASESVDSAMHELADAGLLNPIISAGGRMYTIPKAAQAEAKKALEWRKEEGRGGTDVGLNTARTLAKGGQIGLKKVRHIAKYFPRHEVDKQGKGWKPSEDGFPSNGRIAWALWGGDAAWRWAKAIVEREEKAMTAAGFAPEFDAYLDGTDVSEFETAYESEEYAGPEFVARIRMDGSGLDRLYKIDPDGEVFVWDDGRWDDLGMANQDIWSYDAELDSSFAYDFIARSHTVVDPNTAIFLAARFLEAPNVPVTIEQIDAEEAQLAADAISSVDWEFIDRTLVAAGETDGVYTPEERSENASEQIRDATGRFAKTGSRVVVGGDLANGAGQITRLNPDAGTVTVRLDNGNTVDVPGNTIEPEDTYDTNIPDGPVLDTSGILGEPRTPVNNTVAQIPGTLPAMRQEDLQLMLADWPAYVAQQRASFKDGEGLQRVGVQGKDSTSVGEYGEAFQKAVGKSLTTDAYDHPLLKDWLKRSDKNGVANRLWYNPITAAGKVVKEIVPQTSDVQPIYMAVVDADDPRAVTALVSLVPANDQSTAPMTYSRKEGKWVRDPAMLADLNSATPPPVVPLDSETLNDVLIQVDETQGVTASVALTVLFGNTAITAAGGLDRNKGKAEELRRYWTRGKGAAKIRWGTDGDWTRCYRNLSKYMGPRAKGYCALRHKEMNGIWPGEHQKRQFVANEFGIAVYTDEVLRSEDEIIAVTQLAIRADELKARVAGAYGFVNNDGMDDDDTNVETQTFFFHEKKDMPVVMEKVLKDYEPVDEQEIDIADLIPSQNTVNMRRVSAVIESMKPVKVLITEEGPVLIDGHHRTVARMLSGYNTVPAKIYKIDEED